MENCTDAQFRGHDEESSAQLAMHISDNRRDPPDASTHSIKDLRDQAYREVMLCRDLVPFLEDLAIRIEILMFKNGVLYKKFAADKPLLDRAIRLLSIPKEAIYSLNEERCRMLLESIKKVVTPMRRDMRPAPRRVEAQPWASKIYLGPEELIHPANPSKGVLPNNWYDHLYIEVKYMDYMYSRVLVHQFQQLEQWISEVQVPANKLASLKIFLEKSLNLMALRRADFARVCEKECRMLVKMIKLFVVCKLLEGLSNPGRDNEWHIPHILNLYAISDVLQQVNMTTSSNQVGMTLAFEGDWHDQAHKEILSMRILYWSLLDGACCNLNIERLCNVLSVEARKFLKKSLGFLTTSRAEMYYLSKEKCYGWMMLIKYFAVLYSVGVSAKPYASSGSARQIQLESSPSWRDLVYEEVRGISKKYSSVFDEAYSTKLELCKQDQELAAKLTTFLVDTWNFLLLPKAVFAIESKENYLAKLMRIREFLRCPKEFDSAEKHAKFVQSLSKTGEVNWRDEAYEEIKCRVGQFDKVEVACQWVFEMGDKIPGLGKQLDELNEILERVEEFFTMPRYELALLSEEQYYMTAEGINGDLAMLEERLTGLQIRLGKRIAFPCNFRKLKLKKLQKST